MTDTDASADTSLPAPVPAAALWLPASALNCYEGDALRRSWLLTPGLLTQRIRDTAGAQFAMQVLCERRFGEEHVREIEMRCGTTVWLFAHTRVPPATSRAHPWLGAVGGRTLGEALAERHDIERTPHRYAQLGADVWLVARALTRAGLPASSLWVRHSAFAVAGAPFDLYEVFLPAIGRMDGAIG